MSDEVLVDDRPCQDCGQENPVWFADNEVWNAVFPERVGYVCPCCFIKRADRIVANCGWKLIPDNPSVDHVKVCSFCEGTGYEKGQVNGNG